MHSVVAMDNSEGRFVKIPYDWRRPTRERFRRRWFNRADRRLIVPTPWGWGYSLNLGALLPPGSKQEER